MRTKKNNETESEDIVEHIDGEKFEKLIDDRYLAYSYHVMESRAIPDARDGLKPVQRAILFGMDRMGLKPNKTVKSANITGVVMGDYHPHGDFAIYETIVNMVQPWKSRNPLVRGQGNWGSVDGYSQAASRYTECTLTGYGDALLDDVSEDVVPFIPNYDDRLRMPSILPARFPNLLVNGTSGIAVGVATKMAPHNLREVANVISAYINNNNITTDEILNIMPGCDFPTGGIIKGQKGIRDYYETGHGCIKIDGVYEIETDKKGNQKIVVTELPYESSPSDLAEEIGNLVESKKITGVDDIKDLSSGKKGETIIRVEVYINKIGNSNLILNQILKSTCLRKSFNVNATVTVNKRIIENTSIIKLVQIFVDHRKDVLTKRFQSELRKNNGRVHIIEGLLNVLSDLDAVIALIRSSDSPDEDLIKSGFVQTEEQAKAVLSLTLRSITKLETLTLQNENKKLIERNDWLTSILSNEKRLLKLIAKEQLDFAEQYGDDRRTQIGSDIDEITNEDLIPKEDVMISLTKDGYIKRLPLDTYKVQNRGGKGVQGVPGREDDEASDIFIGSTHDVVLFFTTSGVVHKRKGYEIPLSSRTAKGTHIANLLSLQANEKVTNTITLPSLDQDGYLLMVTRNGLIKRSEIREYNTSLKTKGLNAIKLNDGDSLAFVEITDGKQDVFLSTAFGKAIRYNEDLVRVTGRVTAGVRALNLGRGDKISQLLTLNPKDNSEILVVTSLGFGKKSSADHYRCLSGRNAKGVNTIDVVKKDRNGEIVGAATVDKNDTLFILTTKGKIIQIPVDSIRSVGRTAMGVKIVNLDANDSVTTITKSNSGGDVTELSDIPTVSSFKEIVEKYK